MTFPGVFCALVTAGIVWAFAGGLWALVAFVVVCLSDPGYW